MATIRSVDVSARARVRKSRPDDRAPYREAITNLTGNRVLELTPDEGESLRKLKTMVTRAANEVERVIAYGETPEGTLLVWPATARRRRRRAQAE
jgi:hypothetical protein